MHQEVTRTNVLQPLTWLFLHIGCVHLLCAAALVLCFVVCEFNKQFSAIFLLITVLPMASYVSGCSI